MESKNMENLNKQSKPYLTGEYAEMFNASEISSMAEEDVIAYRTSIMEELERESELEYAKEDGIKEGKLDVAKNMKLNGVPLGDIMLYTGLTEKQVRDL